MSSEHSRASEKESPCKSCSNACGALNIKWIMNQMSENILQNAPAITMWQNGGGRSAPTKEDNSNKTREEKKTNASIEFQIIVHWIEWHGMAFHLKTQKFRLTCINFARWCKDKTSKRIWIESAQYEPVFRLFGPFSLRCASQMWKFS